MGIKYNFAGQREGEMVVHASLSQKGRKMRTYLVLYSNTSAIASVMNLMRPIYLNLSYGVLSE